MRLDASFLTIAFLRSTYFSTYIFENYMDIFLKVNVWEGKFLVPRNEISIDRQSIGIKKIRSNLLETQWEIIDTKKH